MLNNLSTKDKMFARGLNLDILIKCVFCFGEDENVNHLFFGCTFSSEVWIGIMRWLQLEVDLPIEEHAYVKILFIILSGRLHSDKNLVICSATCWSLWCCRNNILFRGDVENVGYVVHNVKVIACQWHIIHINSKIYSIFYYWRKAPLLYLNLS